MTPPRRAAAPAIDASRAALERTQVAEPNRSDAAARGAGRARPGADVWPSAADAAPGERPGRGWVHPGRIRRVLPRSVSRPRHVELDQDGRHGHEYLPRARLSGGIRAGPQRPPIAAHAARGAAV